MTNEFITVPEGPDTQDGFFRFSQGISYTDRVEEEHAPFSFAETGPPTETDLLPDEEMDSILRNKRFTNANEYDVAVIGGGPAGYTAAIRASKLGAKTLLFEKEMLGGLASGNSVIVNIRKTLAHNDIVATSLTANLARLLRSYRVRVEAGEASLKNAREIVCRGKTYSASKVILCGGTETVRPDIPGMTHHGVWTIGDVFKAKETPSRLMVFGGGSAGCETAIAFAVAGSSVMLVEPGPQLLPGMDTQLAEAVRGALAKAGVKIYTGISVKEIVDRDGYPFIITERGGVLCDKFLLAAKRMLDMTQLGSLAKDIAVRSGAIVVNEYLETSIPGIYAAGGCAGLGSQAHVAYRMGETAAENAMGRHKVIDLRAVPVTVYTMPGAASVGLSEAEAFERYGNDVVVGTSLFSNNMRAILSGKTEGFVKVLAGRKHGEIYGVHIYGEEAVEMIAEAAALIRMEVTVHEVCGDIIHAHPTYMEAFAEACKEALNRGVGE